MVRNQPPGITVRGVPAVGDNFDFPWYVKEGKIWIEAHPAGLAGLEVRSDRSELITGSFSAPFQLIFVNTAAYVQYATLSTALTIAEDTELDLGWAVLYEPQVDWLSSRAEMESVFSINGVAWRSDDDVTDFDALVNDCIEEATLTFFEAAFKFYDPDSLVGSRWVRRRVSYMACHDLSQRRGNPALFCEKMEKIEAELERLRAGRLMIPGAVPAESMSPAMANITIDHRYWHRQNRVDVQASVNAEHAEDKDRGLFWEYPFG